MRARNALSEPPTGDRPSLWLRVSVRTNNCEPSHRVAGQRTRPKRAGCRVRTHRVQGTDAPIRKTGFTLLCVHPALRLDTASARHCSGFDFVAFALFAGLPERRFRVVNDLFGLGIPFQRSIQTNRNI